MYEMKDWEDAGQMLQYLNALPPHEIVTLVLDNNGYWRSVVRIFKEAPVTLADVEYAKVTEAPKKKRMVRPKGWKPGDPYVPMEDK